MFGAWRRLPWRGRAVGVAVVVAAVAAVVWWLWGRGSAADAQEVPTTRTVSASLETLERTVTTTGTLTPLVQESVGFGVAGTVTSVAVAAGDTVTAGQVLATVDTLQLEADRLAAVADLAEAQADLAAARQDDDGSSAADARIAALAAQVEVRQVAADEAAAALEGATLLAPVAGLVTSVDLEVGDVVGASGGGDASAPTGLPGGDATSSATASGGVTIVGTDAWRVDATVGESDVALVEVGDQVEMTSDDLPGTVFGVVGEIGLVSSSTSGSAAYPVTVTVTSAAEGMHDGIAVDVEIVYERRTNVLTVPSAAVTTGDDGATTVTRLDEDGDEVQVQVETGDTAGDLVEIVSGLAEGDEVVVQVFTPGAGGGQQGVPAVPDGFPELPEGFDPRQLDPSQFGGAPGQGPAGGGGRG